jgi:uncharacterized radical SAM superfamily Fe-S cluster-containing enzyme
VIPRFSKVWKSGVLFLPRLGKSGNVSHMTRPTPTQAYCITCKKVVPAAVLEETGRLYLEQTCPQCGTRRSLIEHDAKLYKHWETIRRPHRPPPKFQTAENKGCPFDCGLCPNHRQKSCITLIEVTTACDLGCPVCYAESGAGEFQPLETIERMLDAAVDSADGQPDVLQISGGEPTCHPQILNILRAAMKRPFKYVMLNTNGLALQNGTLDVAELAKLGNGVEVYLQFDGLDDTIYTELRGRPLLAEKMAVLDQLAKHKIPATLVATLRRGLNLEQIGDLLRYALNHSAVRGINYQCEAFFGRNPAAGAPPERVTQTEVVNVLSHTANELLSVEDVLPLSCGLACMVYLENLSNGWKPVPRELASAWEKNPLTTTIEDLYEAAATACLCKRGDLLASLARRLPKNLLSQSIQSRSQLVQERFFHITIAGFLDGWNFDLNRACRECAHVMQPDGTKIPFSAFNTIYRSDCV